MEQKSSTEEAQGPKEMKKKVAKNSGAKGSATKGSKSN
jgi:hypothetical protein